MNAFDLHKKCPLDAAEAVAKWLRRCGHQAAYGPNTNAIYTDADAETFDLVCWHIGTKTPEAWATYLSEPEELNHHLK